MSLSQFSKDHGNTIKGVGCISLAAAFIFAVQGTFSRVDDIKEIMKSIPQTVERLEAARTNFHNDIDDIRSGVKKDLSDFKNAIPGVGTITGEGAANAIKRADEMLKVDQDDGQLKVRTKEFLNGFVRDKLKPKP